MVSEKTSMLQATELALTTAFVSQSCSPLLKYSDTAGSGYTYHYREQNEGKQDEPNLYEKSQTSSPPTKYRLAEFARLVDLSPQHVINLITRYGVIDPPKEVDLDSKETYCFSQRDIEKVERFKDLARRRIPLQDAANLVRTEERYKQVAKEMKRAISTWLKDQDAESWIDLLEALSKSPTLSREESKAFFLVEAHKKTLGQCIKEVDVSSEQEVKVILHGAYNKLGFDLLQLLQLSVEPL